MLFFSSSLTCYLCTDNTVNDAVTGRKNMNQAGVSNDQELEVLTRVMQRSWRGEARRVAAVGEEGLDRVQEPASHLQGYSEVLLCCEWRRNMKYVYGGLGVLYVWRVRCI